MSWLMVSNQTSLMWVSGVPPGTMLDHLLFLLHITNLPSVVASKVKLFADDCLTTEILELKDQISSAKIP